MRLELCLKMNCTVCLQEFGSQPKYFATRLSTGEQMMISEYPDDITCPCCGEPVRAKEFHSPAFQKRLRKFRRRQLIQNLAQE